MGRQASGVRGGLQPGDSNKKSTDIKNIEPLINIKDPQVYKSVKEAINRYHSVLGVRQREIKLADLSKETLGVHVTKNGNSAGVYINKDLFKNGNKQEIITKQTRGYKSGWATLTNKPIAHTVTHELGHATWNEHLTSAKHKAAGKEINKLYNTWKKDKTKTGYGKYASHNVSEFWAETVTKAVHGTADKYTREVKRIVKKYKL